MAHVFTRLPVAVPEGTPASLLGVTSSVRCSNGCNTEEAAAPPEHLGKLFRGGAWLDGGADALLCPIAVQIELRRAQTMADASVRALRAHPTPPDGGGSSRDCVPPGAGVDSAAASPRAAAAAAGPSGPSSTFDWSSRSIRSAPPAFEQRDLDAAVVSIRDLSLEEFRREVEGRHVSDLLLDGYTDQRHRVSDRGTRYRCDPVDSIPRRRTVRAGASAYRAATLMSILWRGIGRNPDVRAAMAAAFENPSLAFPRAEVLGLADPSKASLLDVAQAAFEAIAECDGETIEAAHFPNQLAAAKVDGESFLDGSAARPAEIKTQPMLAYLVERELDGLANERARQPLLFRPIALAIRDSRLVRLSFAFRLPPDSVLRARLLGLHWRHYWFGYAGACDAVRRDQAALATEHARHIAQTASASAIVAALRRSGPGGRGATGADRRSTAGNRGAGADPPVRAKKRGRGQKRDPAGTGRTAAAKAGADAAGADDSSPAHRSPAAKRLMCNAAKGCAACGVPKGTHHKADCAWLSRVLASQAARRDLSAAADKGGASAAGTGGDDKTDG